jgi:hypothetical protein
VADQLDYNYNLLQTSPGDVNTSTVQFGMSVLNGLAGMTKANEQAALSSKLQAQVTDYAGKFSKIIGSSN